ncbi:MAG TPA: hypothetical protein VJT81_06690 [Burkholderiales bacterium]|nr:hypothetical protein [Burkholderiales bacterium]
MKVNREEAANFAKAVGHYQVQLDEVLLMKAAYERDHEGAAICFAAIAFHVDRMTARPLEKESSINGEQFLKLGAMARELEKERGESDE